MNIDIDDDLLTEAMAVIGLPTKKATIEEALRRLVQRGRRRKALADIAGLGWQRDLGAMPDGAAPSGVCDRCQWPRLGCQHVRPDGADRAQVGRRP